MRSSWIKTILLAGLATLSLSSTYEVASTGAPIGSTGAPGETTCARSGCHIGDNNLNTGTGELGIDIKGFDGSYVPGQSYEITVSLSQEEINRFGFSMVALNDQQRSTGTFLVKDESRTQVFAGSNQFEGRNYITYTNLGTNPYAKNLGQWSFTWKAPDQDEGAVTFYLAAVSADNDGTDLGDEVYTDSLRLTASPGTGIMSTPDNTAKMAVYPNPVKNQFCLAFDNSSDAQTQVQLTDLTGKNVCGLWEGRLKKGKIELPLSLPADLAKGVYFINIRQNAAVRTHKILVEP